MPNIWCLWLHLHAGASLGASCLFRSKYPCVSNSENPWIASRPLSHWLALFLSAFPWRFAGCCDARADARTGAVMFNPAGHAALTFGTHSESPTLTRSTASVRQGRAPTHRWQSSKIRTVQSSLYAHRSVCSLAAFLLATAVAKHSCGSNSPVLAGALSAAAH